MKSNWKSFQKLWQQQKFWIKKLNPNPFVTLCWVWKRLFARFAVNRSKRNFFLPISYSRNWKFSFFKGHPKVLYRQKEKIHLLIYQDYSLLFLKWLFIFQIYNMNGQLNRQWWISTFGYKKRTCEKMRFQFARKMTKKLK